MKALSWNLAIFLLLIGYAVDGINITVCDRVINIKCSSYKILIADINTTTLLAYSLLRKCNLHQQCNVENTQQECVHISYWCIRGQNNVDMPESSGLHLIEKLSSFSLMSHNYQQGKYAGVRNISCRLGAVQNNITRRMEMTVNELSAESSVANFCLSVNAAKKCSSSQNLSVSYGPFKSNTGWHFVISFPSSGDYVSNIRFWINIHVSPYDEDQLYRLDCDTHSSADGQITTIIKVAVPVITLVVIVTLAVLAAKCRTCRIQRNLEEHVQPDAYTDVDEPGETIRNDPGKQDIVPFNEEFDAKIKLQRRPTLPARVKMPGPKASTVKYFSGLDKKVDESMNAYDDIYQRMKEPKPGASAARHYAGLDEKVDESLRAYNYINHRIEEPEPGASAARHLAGLDEKVDETLNAYDYIYHGTTEPGPGAPAGLDKSVDQSLDEYEYISQRHEGNK